jgi:hypothetical protein
MTMLLAPAAGFWHLGNGGDCERCHTLLGEEPSGEIAGAVPEPVAMIAAVLNAHPARTANVFDFASKFRQVLRDYSANFIESSLSISPKR